MLILTRKPGEAFRIGADICVSVIETSGDKVRIGIDAPRNIRVLREELVEIESANQQAAVGADSATLHRMAASLKKRLGTQPDEALQQTPQTKKDAE